MEKGFIQDEIAKASYDFQKKMELGQKVIVGVNKFVEPERNDTEILRIDDSIRALQTAKLVKLRAERNADEVNKTLKALKEATVDGKNIMPFVVNAVEAYCTLGEVADVLRGIYGEYQG